MKFTDEEREKFLKDEPFYKDKDSYCLGDSLQEAGEVFRKLCGAEIQRKESAADVGMA